MDPASSPHTLLLPIDSGVWPPPSRDIEVGGIEFAAKTELHITVIGSRLGHELTTSMGPVHLRQWLTRAFSAGDWQWVRTGHFLQLTRRAGVNGDRRTGEATTCASIIELVDVPAMRPFYQDLGRLLGRQLPVPPPHVTLYTAGNPKGIGVASPLRLRAFRVREIAPRAVESDG